MKFKYVGEANDPNPHDSVEIFGITFPKDQPVEVTDENAIRRLSGNSHFVKVTAKATAKKASAKKATA